MGSKVHATPPGRLSWNSEAPGSGVGLTRSRARMCGNSLALHRTPRAYACVQLKKFNHHATAYLLWPSYTVGNLNSSFRSDLHKQTKENAGHGLYEELTRQSSYS